MIEQADHSESEGPPSPQWEIDDPLVVIGHEIRMAEHRRNLQIKLMVELSRQKASLVHPEFVLREIEATLQLLRQYRVFLIAISN